MRKYFVDTNVFLRFLTGDHPRQSPACKRLFKKAAEGKVLLVTLPIVIAEIVWVLDSFYKEKRRSVAEKVRTLLLFKNLEVSGRDILLMAIDDYEQSDVDFIDAYITGWMGKVKLKDLYSYDKDFDELEGVRRREP